MSEEEPGPGTDDKREAAQRFASGRLLKRNVLVNIGGQVAPLLVALISVPIAVKGFGTERFGILSLAWALNAYFGVFDLGIGRALTKAVADRLGRDEPETLPALVRTALVMVLPIGLAGGLLLAALTPWLADQWLDMSDALRGEARQAFWLIAASVPLTVMIAASRGVLEAHQAFRRINAVRVPMAALTFAGPILVLPFTQNLAAAVAVLLLVRMAGLTAFLLMAARIVPGLFAGTGLDAGGRHELLRLGGWITATNLIAPFVAYIDRFVIGALSGAAAVAYYATPYEILTRVLILPGAMVGVLFPAFATSSQVDPERTRRLYDRANRLVFLAMILPLAFASAFALEIMTLWIDADFAVRSAGVLQFLSFAVFSNGIGYVAFALVQGLGRPDLNAKYSLIEAPIYPFVVWYLVDGWGVEGAAAAWGLRNLVALSVVVWLAHRISDGEGRQIRFYLLLYLAALGWFTSLLLAADLADRAALFGGGAVLVLLVGYRLLLGDAERAMVRGLLSRLAPSRRGGD